MNSSCARALILVVFAVGCGNSLRDPGEKVDPNVGTDDTPVDDFEVIEDVTDTRRFPTACETASDCSDNDPCTYDICLLNECEFVAKDIVFSETWVETVGSAIDVKLTEDRLLVAEGEDGVEVFSIADIGSPEKLGVMSTTGSAWSIDFAVQTTSVAEKETGVETFNDSFEQTSLRPPGQGSYSKADSIEHVVIGPTVLIFSALSAGGLVVNRADGSLLGQVNTAGRAVRAAVNNETFGLIADSLVGAVTFVFGTEEPPFVGGKITTQGRTLDVAISGDTGLMAEYGAGFGVLDLSEPSNPKRLARFPSRAPIIGVELIGPQTAVVVEETGGRVTVYGLLNPFIPKSITTWDTEQSPSPREGLVGRNIDIHGDLIAVAMDQHGVLLLETGCTPAPESDSDTEE